MRLDAHFDMLPMRAFQRGPSGSIMPQGGKGSTIEAPAPDPNIGAAQKQMSQLNADYMDLWKNQIWPGLKEQSATQEDRANQQFAFDKQMQERQAAIADEQYGRYKEKFLPMQDELIKQANEYDTAANRERMASEALGDVESQFAISRANRAREGAAYGIDPTSGRYTGAANAEGVLEAATKASAATRARDAAVQLGWAKKMDAIGLGSNIFGNQATSTGLALNAGNQAMAMGQIPISNYGAMGSSASGAYGQATQGWNQVGGLGVQKYNADVNAYNSANQANSQRSSALGSAIGGIGGMLMSGGAKGFGASAIGAGLKGLGFMN